MDVAVLNAILEEVKKVNANLEKLVQMQEERRSFNLQKKDEKGETKSLSFPLFSMYPDNTTTLVDKPIEFCAPVMLGVFPDHHPF